MGTGVGELGTGESQAVFAEEGRLFGGGDAESFGEFVGGKLTVLIVREELIMLDGSGAGLYISYCAYIQTSYGDNDEDTPKHISQLQLTTGARNIVLFRIPQVRCSIVRRIMLTPPTYAYTCL